MIPPSTGPSLYHDLFLVHATVWRGVGRRAVAGVVVGRSVRVGVVVRAVCSNTKVPQSQFTWARKNSSASFPDLITEGKGGGRDGPELE